MDDSGPLTAGADLLLTGGAAALAVPMVLLAGDGNPLRIVVGLALILLLPGYALVSALLPRGDPDGIGGTERVVLAFALSLAVTLLGGIALSASGIGFFQTPLLGLLAGVTLVGTAVAGWRRSRLSRAERFEPDFDGVRAAVRGQTVEAEPLDAALTGLAVVSVLVLVVSVLFTGPLTGALAAATGGDAPSDPTFTEMFLLTGPGGDAVSDRYPTALAPGESATLTVGLDNREGEQTRYTVLVLAQRVENGSVVAERQQHRFGQTLAPGSRWFRPHTVQPGFPDGEVRLQYLVYRGDPPESPTVENAYRELHVWLDVAEN